VHVPRGRGRAVGPRRRRHERAAARDRPRDPRRPGGLRAPRHAVHRRRPVRARAPTVSSMRILHTSDWHLGRTLHGVDLTDAHADYLDHLVEVVRAERVDAVVVAGDVYDRAIPPTRSVTLLGEALARLTEVT